MSDFHLQNNWEIERLHAATQPIHPHDGTVLNLLQEKVWHRDHNIIEYITIYNLFSTYELYIISCAVEIECSLIKYVSGNIYTYTQAVDYISMIPSGIFIITHRRQ